MSLHPSPPTDTRICPSCGYDLRHLTSIRCPECGLRIDSVTTLSPIPWQHRRHLGRWRALRRTVVRATFRPRTLFDPQDLQLNFAAANKFRWTVLLLAAIPLAVFVPLARLQWPPSAFSGPALITDLDSIFPLGPWQAETMWVAGITMALIPSLAILLTLVLATAASALLCRRRSLAIPRQNRAVALVTYATGPLAWFVLPTVCIAAALIVDKSGQDLSPALPTSLLGLACLIVLVITAFWAWSTQRLLGLATGAQLRRKLFNLLSLSVLWLASAAVGLILFPMIAGLLWLMLDSLR